MPGVIVDKRQAKNRAASNRKAFVERYKGVLKDHVDRLANSKSRSITDIAEKRKITIKKSDINEPEFQYDRTFGEWDRVLPGNDRYHNGDQIPIPKDGQGKGSGSGGEGSGESSIDEFSFTLTEDEFYDILFSGMALPDFVKEGMKTIEFAHMQRAGYRKQGSPCQLDIKKTFENAIARRIASGEQASVPYLDDIDLRYKNFIEVTKPSKHAVMFCVLDVSASMSETLKLWAKKYFLLLYVFLKRVYTSIEVVFIRHHDTAQEVPEKDFFYAKDTGGTCIASALTLMDEIIKERYADDVNIYIAQCSDGENFGEDSENSYAILETSLLPMIQYYSYVEVSERYTHYYNTWGKFLSTIKSPHKKIATGIIGDESEIFQVFRKLFAER